jgi:Calx-beta domain
MLRSSLVVIAVAVVACSFGGCSGGGGGGNEGVISFLAAAFSVNEDGSVIDAITLRRVGGAASVTVTVTMSDGSATSPADYDATPIVVTWLAGDLADKVIAVAVVNDNIDEPDEFLTMTLGSPTGGAVIGAPGSATLTIVDDDDAGTVQFDASAYTRNEDGSTAMPVTVTRTGGMDGDISVTVVATDGTANSDPLSLVEPVDYSGFAITVNFADQSTTPVVVTWTVVQDLLPELDETFTVSLVTPTGGAMLGSPSTATVTIIDDDSTQTISKSQFPSANLEFGTTVAKVGPYLAIGIPRALNGGFTNAGRVDIVNPADATVVTSLTRPLTFNFGRSMAVDGNTLAIGAVGQVFVMDATTFVDRFVLSSSEDGFGDAMIGLGDGRFVVGAPQAQGPGGSSPSGAFHVYDALTGNPLQSVAGVGSDQVGSHFARSPSALYVGAPGEVGYVLEMSGTPLTLDYVHANPFPQATSPAFGASFDFALGVLGVGAPFSDLFANDGGIVTFSNALGSNGQISGALANIRLGSNVVTIGTRICLQSKLATGAGQVTVVSVSNPMASSIQTIDDPAPTTNGDFGASMCEFDGVLVIGAPHADVGGTSGIGKVVIVKIL